MSKRKLLLADDSITIQKVVNLTFADEGIEVFTYSDGDTASENIASVDPDIILADVHMPGLNGYQICEQVRADESKKNIPVLLLVGSFEPFDQSESDRVGATGHLTKPFSSIADLVARVKDVLDSVPATNGGASEPATAPADDIENLYRQSFEQTVEMPHSEALDAEFNDDNVVEFGEDSLDDEMIQTSYVEESDLNSSINADTAEQAYTSDLAEDSEPVFQEPSEFQAGPMQELQNEPESESLEFVEAETPEAKAEEGATAFDDAEIFDSADQRPNTEEASSIGRAESEQNKAEFQFDEIDLLELPEISGGQSVQFTTAEKAAEAGSNAQVVSLSPELMEILVQKVVEKLSEKY